MSGICRLKRAIKRGRDIKICDSSSGSLGYGDFYFFLFYFFFLYVFIFFFFRIPQRWCVPCWMSAFIAHEQPSLDHWIFFCVCSHRKVFASSAFSYAPFFFFFFYNFFFPIVPTITRFFFSLSLSVAFFFSPPVFSNFIFYCTYTPGQFNIKSYQGSAGQLFRY